MSFDGPPPVHGDRNALTRDELDTLENRVLPTARSWLRDYPALAHHAKKTLAYWGEQV